LMRIGAHAAAEIAEEFRNVGQPHAALHKPERR
jgi:hypothetical protein